MYTKLIATAVFSTVALTNTTLSSPEAQPVQSGPSSMVLTCVAETDGPPGGCPSGDCVTACTIVNSVGSTTVDVYLLLEDGESMPTQVILTQDEGTAVYTSEVPFTTSQLVLRDEWMSVDDHDTGGTSATSSSQYTIELVF